MEVRRAKYDDIKAMIDFMAEYHTTSNQSDVPFIRKDVAKVLDYYIGRKDCYPIVAINVDGSINGILLAELVPFFFNRREFYITDTMFISNGAGMHLLRELKRWHKEVGSAKLIMGVSSGDQRADSFLELSGLEKTGSMYVLRR